MTPTKRSRTLRLRLHVHLGEDHSLGPGKVQLLETVRELGSITAAARAMGMAYRHAWDLIDDLDRSLFVEGERIAKVVNILWIDWLLQ